MHIQVHVHVCVCSCIYLGSEVPVGYCAEAVHGFVEELVVNDDPEYQVCVCGLIRSGLHALPMKRGREYFQNFQVCVCVCVYTMQIFSDQVIIFVTTPALFPTPPFLISLPFPPSLSLIR